MTTRLIDPALSGADLRRRLYDGNLVILTRLRVLADFVDYTCGKLAELFKPHDPEHVAGSENLPDPANSSKAVSWGASGAGSARRPETQAEAR